MKQRTGKKLLGFLRTLTLVLGLTSGMSLTAYAADSTVSNEADLRSALSASESGKVTLGNNIVISTDLTSNGTKILDLNGYGILMTGNGRVITVTANGNLTINDSDTTKAHVVTLANYRGTAVADGTGITSVTNGTGTVYIKGGYLTGGNTEWGSAILLNGDLTINGGTILGTTSNTSGAIRVNGGHVLTLNGGQIIYNRGASAADNGGAVNEEANGMIRFSENPVVEHNYDANGRARNVNIRSNITTMPKVIAPLKDGAEIGITMQNLAGVFISGDNTDYNDPSKFFMDRATSYSEITRNSSGQLEIKIITDPAHYKVDGNTITLMDTTGWDIFCDLLESNANGYYTGKTVVMGDSFPITRMAGNDAHRFTGTFDGNKKTLTVDITRNENSCAPFSHVENATIKDLKVEGTLTTNQKFAAGIAAFTYGTTNITDCLSSVTIKSSISGDGTHGGFVGVNEGGGNLTMTGCVFNGSMLGENTGYCGGFVGWTTAAIKFTDCLFDPGTLTIQAGGGGTFQRNSMSSTFSNAYYMKAYGSGYTGQGKQAYSITHGDDVEIDFGTPVKEYNVSGIASYATGIEYAGTFYAGSGEEIPMTLKYLGTSDLRGYTVTLSDGKLEMPAYNVVVSAITVPVARVNYGQTTTEYGTLAEAVSAWNSAESGARLTLLADVTTANTISVTGTKTLDLNGYGIKMTGSGRVLNVSGGANLTLEDSNPNATHKYTIASPKSNGAGLAVVDDRNGSTQFTGGYITGGNVSNDKGGGIQVKGGDQSGSLTMKGGTVIGNRVEGPVHGGGIAVIGASDTFNMTGGSIIGNTAAYGGGLSLMGSSSGTISGGVIKYNYTTRNGGGVHTDESPTLTITGGMIVNNYTDGEEDTVGRHGGGIIVDNGKGINLSDNPTIEGNQKGGVTENVYLYDNNKINITGELSNNTSIGISMQNIGVFTNSTDTDYNDAFKFTSDNKNYEVRKNDGGQLYLYALPAASVTNGKTTTEYGTLSEAVSAWNTAASGATLTLLGNVGTSSVINVSGVKNLDLNGKTLTLSKEYAITVGSGSNLTIGGDGNIKNSVNAHFIKVDGGTLTVDGPVMQSAMGGINVTNHGTLYFKSGSMMLDNGTAVNVEGGSTANLYGGTFRSTQHLCGYADGSGSNINISGGIFKGAKLLQPNGGTITVSGGYFTDKISTCGATIATGYAIVGSDDQDKGTKMVVPLQTISAENVAVTYGDADKKVDASVTVPQTGGGAISYAVNNGSERFIEVNATTGALTIKKVPATGTAYVTVTAAATDGFAKTTKEVTVTISKANAIAATVTANNRTYDGTEQPLVTVDDSTLVGGEMRYALGTATGATEAYTTTIPSKTNAGIYYVWYKVVGDGNHKDTEPAYVEAKINPVDKTALNSAINDATTLYNSIKDDPTFGYIAPELETAIEVAQGVAGNDNVDESTVSNAETAIKNAKTNAEKKITAYFVDALAAIKQINKDNRNDVKTLLDIYDRLNISLKTVVDKKIGRAGTKKLSDLEEALDVTDRIYALKPLEDIQLRDERTITYARTAYELLSDSQKAMISEETLTKLTDAENKIEKLKGQDTLAAVKASAIERLKDYAAAKALADFSEAEKEDYNAVVGAEEAKINAAGTQDDVATALTNAKAAVDTVFAKIKKDRADKAAAEEAMAKADKALEDAKASAKAAKEEADKAVKDEYASDEDKTAINNTKKVLDTKIKAAADLPATATAKDKEDAAKAIEDAVNELNEAIDTAKLNSAKAKAKAEEAADKAAQLAAAKASAIERLTDYSEAKALADFSEAEEKAYEKAVNGGKDAISAAGDQTAVATALTNAKAAVNEVLDQIRNERAAAETAVQEKKAADQAIADAKTAAETAKKAADEAETNEYASYIDRQAIRDANTELETAMLAAAGLSEEASAVQKQEAANAINAAVEKLKEATDTANVNSDAKRKAEEEAATEAEQLEAAKTSAIARLTDYSEAKALADAKTDEQTAYEQAVADGIRIIEAVENKEDVAAALAEAKVKVNDALAMIESDRAEASAKAAAQAEADKAIADATSTAEEAKAAADAAAGDKYASDTDKAKITEAETKLKNAIQAAAELGEDATVADKEKVAADIKTATEELNSVTNTAIINSEYAKAAATEAAQLMAAKTSANERLDDYSEAKVLKDATPEEKEAYDKAVADGRKAIEDAADQDAVAQALKDAKAAVDAALAKIEEERAKAAEEAAAMAAADKAVTDAKETATEAAASADRAAADEYASEDDKKAISDAKAALEKAVGDADKLPEEASAVQKQEAAKAIEDAVKDLNAATDKANVDSAAARAAAGEAATEAEKLARAKEAAIGRLEDYSELKALADATEDEKKYYDGVVAAEKEKINAAADQSAVTEVLTAAKEAVNAAIEKIKKDRGDASSAEAVTAAINALPAKDKITEDNRAAIEAARAAYEALSADQKALVTADTLKKLKDAEDQLVILKAMGQVSAKTGSDVICTGEPIILVNGPVTALPEGYTMQYALGTDAATEPAAAAYSTSIPTGTEAGTYYVWYKVRGEGDRGDSKARVVSVSLIKDDSEVLEEDIPEGGIPAGIWIAGVKDLEYTGKALTQEFRLYDGNKRLIEKKDYTVSYKNNTKVYTVEDPKKLTAEDEKNAPSIIIKMKGNYGDVEPAYFNINAIDISTDGFSVSDISTAYNGLKQTPAPVLTWNGKKLKAGTDFTVKEYIEKKDDGNAFKGQADKTTVYYLTVIGIGNFTGSRDIKLTIAGKTEKTEGKEVPVVLMKDVKTPLIPEQKYTGEEYTIDALKKKDGTKIAFTVLYKSRALTEGKDYEAEFTDARDAGTATLILRGLCSTDSDTGFCFAGEKRITFKIAGLQVSKASVGGIAKSYAYTGNEITPAVTLTIDGKAVPAEDYSVTYEKNVKVGTATAVITGHNSCQGTKKVSFKIAPYDMSTDRGAIVINDGEAIETEYVKGGAQPKISVTFNGKKLFEGGDYTVKFSNNDKVAGARYVDAPTVTITGKGSFKGSKGVNFTIRQREFTEGNGLTLLAPDVNANSKIGSAKIKILDSNGRELKAGTDYEKNIKYTDMSTGKEISADTKPAAGMRLKVEVKGTGLYTSDILTGEIRVIDKTRNISKAKIKIAAQKYTGREVKITDKSQFTTATIKIDGQERGLILGEDFEIVEGSYINNMNKGTAKVTIHGLEGGRYALGGYKTVTFKIGTRSISEWWKGLFNN